MVVGPSPVAPWWHRKGEVADKEPLPRADGAQETVLAWPGLGKAGSCAQVLLPGGFGVGDLEAAGGLQQEPGAPVGKARGRRPPLGVVVVQEAGILPWEERTWVIAWGLWPLLWCLGHAETS